MRPKYELTNLRLGKSSEKLVSVSEVLDVAISATADEIAKGAFCIHLRDNNLDHRMEYLESVTGKEQRGKKGIPYGFPGFPEDWGEVCFDGILCFSGEQQKVSGFARSVWGSAHPVKRGSANQKIYGLQVLMYGNITEDTDITSLTDEKNSNSLLASEQAIDISLLSNLAEEYRNLLRIYGTTQHNLMRLKTYRYFFDEDINREFNRFLYERYGHSLWSEGDIKSDIAIDCRKFLFDSQTGDYSLANLLKRGRKWHKYISSDANARTLLYDSLNLPVEKYAQSIDTAIKELEVVLTKMQKAPEILEVKKYVNKTQVHVDRGIYAMPVIQCHVPTLDILENIVSLIGEVLHQFGKHVLQSNMRPDIMGIPYILSKTATKWMLHDIGLAYSDKHITKSNTYADL